MGWSICLYGSSILCFIIHCSDRVQDSVIHRQGILAAVITTIIYYIVEKRRKGGGGKCIFQLQLVILSYYHHHPSSFIGNDWNRTLPSSVKNYREMV